MRTHQIFTSLINNEVSNVCRGWEVGVWADGCQPRTLPTVRGSIHGPWMAGHELHLQFPKNIYFASFKSALLQKSTQSWQKSYVNVRRRDLEFDVRDWVHLKTHPCRLDLPNELASVHKIFHVSMLKKYVGDMTFIVPLEGFGVKENLYYEEVPVDILDQQVKKFRNKEVASVKVL
ncbi:hypothetical protein MTR67_039277 [Solanum verrucosum]|uniref:Uncharacterized protein n=1 Tax=Solanum verrucosum TaxID=315347 RepID=A0AAF0UGX5_SOLVR|nr:hypothetical protein MTR67_039277 [Solanum verrucosum]